MAEVAASTRLGLNKEQTNTFFMSCRQMEVLKETLVQLGQEGTKKIKDLTECSKDNWKQVAENLKRLGGQMKNPDKEKDNDNPSTIPQTLYLFGVRTQKRLQEASELMRLIWSFTDQWAGLKDRKRQTQPVVPKITAELPIMHWVDVFDDFLSRKIGVRITPLSYVTRETALASRSVSVNSENLPHGEEFGSIEAELAAQASHMHPLYCEDNAVVYYCLEEAV
eukprot:15356484-Ditylum_brightwellii.AAC.1